MSALTADKNTPMREGTFLELDMAADEIAFAGGLAARDSSGNAVPASDTAGLVVVGRFEESADNSGGDAGDVNVKIRHGVFGFDASDANAPTDANIGELVYVEDDQTVSTDPGTNGIVAGRLVDVDDDYCWVDTAFAGPGAIIAEVDGRVAATQADSTAEDVAGVVADLNTLLGKLQDAGLMATA